MSAECVASLLNRRIKQLTADGGTTEDAVKIMRLYLEQERQSKSLQCDQADNVVSLGLPMRLAR